MKQDYHIKTPKGEIVYTEPGDRGPHDMKIFTRFPKQPWKTTLYYIGVILRLKGAVENRNYPPPYQGAKMLFNFCRDCIFSKMPIKDLCKKYKIPE